MGPRDHIASSGKTLLQIATEAGIAVSTVAAVKSENAWPRQRRVREGLKRALGLLDDDQPGGRRVAAEPEY
jgi:hypothetical protein